MLRKLSICLLLVPMLLGCGPRRYPATLRMADSLCLVSPDSAISLLARYADSLSDAPQAVRMYHRLLQIKARDKAYVRHTSDSAILSVLHYYINGGDRRLLPEAYYYAGRVYSDLGDAPQALDYFEKALESMKGGYEDLELKGVVYSQMGTLFSYQNLYKEALAMYQKANEMALVTGDSVGVVFGLRDMGEAYELVGKKDSVLPYLGKALQLARRIGRIDLVCGIQSQRSIRFLERHAYDSARQTLQEAFVNVEYPDRSGIYCITARFYKQTGHLDSAVWYYRQLLDFGTIYAKKEAARELAYMEADKGNGRKAADLLQMYEMYDDSVKSLDQAETVKRMDALYNYQLREKENQRLRSDNNHQQQLIVYLCESGVENSF